MTMPFADVDPLRRRIMSAVRDRDTKPELAVRRVLHAMGYRYRLHHKSLPGKPDIVFGSRKRAIFVHGCFWHRHAGCSKASVPRTRAEFWQAKFDRNVERDLLVERRLDEIGWRSLVVWECETRLADHLAARLRSFLDCERGGTAS